MKKLIMLFPVAFVFFTVFGQGNRTDILQSLEQGNQNSQKQQVTATLKRASRLFGDKDDLTNVIVIIPSGTVVSLLDKDSTYFKVAYEDDEGYIFRKDAEISVSPVNVINESSKEVSMQKEEPQDTRKGNRFAYLEYKYGSQMAALLYAGKIWKGMSSEMIRDSWGAPIKINRIVGEFVKEEWIYKNSWLFIESDRLVEWGPVKTN
jgi:hypothetical protein